MIGATYPGELSSLRRLLPRTPFLIPGVAAQEPRPRTSRQDSMARAWGGGSTCRAAFLYAYREMPGISFEKAAAGRAKELRKELAKVAGLL